MHDKYIHLYFKIYLKIKNKIKKVLKNNKNKKLNDFK